MNIEDMHCKNCKYWRRIYIHPWSEGIPEDLKQSKNGFACVLPSEIDFIGSFNGERSDIDDPRVDIVIGRDDTIGCENFTERELLRPIKIMKGRRCYNCVHYIYDENNNWHDGMCGYSRNNFINKCDPDEAELCSVYRYRERD